MEEQRTEKSSEFDEVFDIVSTFGFYQKSLYLFVSCLKLPMGLQFGLLIFAFGTPSFHCTTANMTCDINKCCVNCTSYSFKDSFTSSVTEWNLICDRAYIAAAIQSCYFAGMLIGSIVGGLLSDAFGRKKCIFLNCFIMATSSLFSAFAESLILSGVLRFIVGYSQIALMVSQYTYLIELVGPRKRTMTSSVTHFFWQLTTAIVLLSYVLPNWRHVVIAGSLPGFIFLVFYKVFPESPRWLVAHGRLDEAHAVLMKYGSKNNEPIDKERLMNMLKSIQRHQHERLKHPTKKLSVLDMFRTPRLRRWSFILCFNWFVISILFFALLLFVSQLYGNIYINFIIMALADIPTICICWLAIALLGRRLPFFTFTIIAGIMCFIFPFIPKEYAITTTVLALLGKSCIAANFSNVYLITSELYPTVIRNIAIGTGSMSARIGAILAPYFVMMAQLPGLSLTFPLCTFGILATVAGFLGLFLPETLFATMQQSIEETEEVQLDYSIPRCGKQSKVYKVTAPITSLDLKEEAAQPRNCETDVEVVSRL